MERRLTPTIVACTAAALVTVVALARPAAPPAQIATGTAATAPAAPGAPTGPARITIADFTFSGDLTVAPGAELTVTNADGTPHTLTASDGGFDTGTLAAGEEAALTAPTTPGTYAVFCSIHPSMTASLVVEA